MKTAFVVCLLVSVVAAEAPSLEKLLADLGSADYQTRREAVLAVEGRKEPELLDRLLVMAEEDPHPNIRGYCADVLATFDDPRVFPLLAKMAAEEQTGPRQHAYVALGRRADPACRKILRKALAGSPQSGAYAAKGLGLHGDPEDFEVVAEFFVAHQENPYVVELVPDALAGIDCPRAVTFLRERFAVLVPYARRNAGKVLARFPSPETRAAMIGHLSSEKKDLRHAAIEVLGAAGEKDAAPALVAHLEGPREDRALTAHALGLIGDAVAAPKLAALLEDGEAGVRTAAAQALGRIGEPTALDALLVALKGEKDGVARIRMIEAVGRIGEEGAIPWLIPFLDDETYVPQPMRISSIWGYPHNVHVHGVAVWSILTLREGKEPFPLDDLMAFATKEPPARIAADVKAIKAWRAKRR